MSTRDEGVLWERAGELARADREQGDWRLHGMVERVELLNAELNHCQQILDGAEKGRARVAGELVAALEDVYKIVEERMATETRAFRSELWLWRSDGKRPPKAEFLELIGEYGRKMQSHPEGRPPRAELADAERRLLQVASALHDEARALESALRDALDVIRRGQERDRALSRLPNTENLALGVQAKAHRLAVTEDGATHRHWDSP